MAQVKKYSKGNQVSKVKLFNYEGIGDYNVDDLTSAYANSINNELSQLDLGDEDKQKILEVTNNIMRGIQSGDIKGRNMSGHFILPENSNLSSSGINEKKKFLGISTGKYKKDEDFYKNTSYALLDKIFKGVSTYTSPKEKSENPSEYKLDFGKVMNDYYFNGTGFDPERWDYSNALNATVARLDDEIKKIQSGNYSNKEDILSRLNDTKAALLDKDPSNDAVVGSRIGFDFRPLFNKNYEIKPKTEEEIKAEEEATEAKKVQELQNKIQEEIKNNRESGDSYYSKNIFIPASNLNNVEDFNIYLKNNPIDWASYKGFDPLDSNESNKLWAYLNTKRAQYLKEKGFEQDGYYYIPESANESQGSIIRINPSKRTLERVPVSTFNKGASGLLYSLEKRYGLKKPWEYKKGGNIVKAQYGWEVDDYDNWVEKEQEAQKNKYVEEERIQDQIDNPTNARKPFKNGLNTEELEWDDYARLGAMASDLVALGAGLTGFTPASTVAGIASTAANFTADMKDGFQWKDLGNAGVNLGLDLVSLVPGLGAATQGSKVVKNLIKWTPRLLALWGASSAYTPAVNALNKLQDKGISSLTTDDFQALANGISAIASGSVGVKNQYKATQLLNKAKTGNVWVKTNKGEVKLTEDQFKELKSKKGLQEQNKYLQDIVGNDKELLTKFGGSKWNPTRNWNNPSTRQDYNFGKTEVKETLKGPIEAPINYGRTNELITKTAGFDKIIPEKIVPDWIFLGPKAYNSFKYRKINSNKISNTAPVTNSEADEDIKSIVDNLGFVQKMGRDFNQQLALPPSNKMSRKINEEKIRKDNPKSDDSVITPLNTTNNFVRVGNGNLETPTSGTVVRNAKRDTKKLQSKQLALPEKGTITTREQNRQNIEEEMNKWWGGVEGFDFYKYNNPYKVPSSTSISYTPNKTETPVDTYYLFQDQVLKSLNKKPTTHRKQENLPHKASSKKPMKRRNDNKGYVNKKQEGGIMKFQIPSGPITNIKAKDMSKWNRNNAIAGYNMAKDIEDYLKTGSDIDSYMAAFNGGEDLYDKMVGNTDYFSGKNVTYTEKNPLAYQRQLTFRTTNKGFDDLIRGSIVGYGTTEGNTGYDMYLGDRTYNRTLGRITEDQANAFNTNQLNKYGIEFYLDPGSGHYRLRRTPVTKLPEVEVTPSPETPQPTVVNSLGKYTPISDSKKASPSIRWDDVIGTGRLLGTISTNNSIAKGLKSSLSPLLLDPLQIRRQVTGDLATRNYMENLGAEANRIGNKPITSDANLALAQALDYNNRAGEYRIKGYLADKEAIDRTTAEARQAAEQNQASRVETANRNRASMLGIQQAKANIEAQRKSANWAQAIAPWLMDKEMKVAENRKINNELDYQENQYSLSNTMRNAVDMARQDMENAKSKYLSVEGNTEDGWKNSTEYKNALSQYNKAIDTASNNYKTGMINARRNIYKYNPFLFVGKSGGKLSYSERALLDRAKDFNKSLLSDRKLFHKIVSDSQKENNKLLMSLSGLTKELIIKSMTI